VNSGLEVGCERRALHSGLGDFGRVNVRQQVRLAKQPMFHVKHFFFELTILGWRSCSVLSRKSEISIVLPSVSQ